MKSPTPFQKIDEEASLWATRIDSGDLNASDQAALSAWLKANPEHQRAFDKYRELSARIDTHVEARLGAAVETVVRERKTSRLRQRVFAATFATAAAIAVLITVLSGRPLSLATKTAERHVTMLDDGTKVDLNARTELSISFTRDERRVRLVSGEALFTVAKDARRPFLVQIPTGSVRVTGTVFNVRAANSERVEVTVLEGTVRVRPAGEVTHEQPVTSGLQAVLSGNAVTLHALPDGTAQDVIAWRQGQVVFNDTPLSEAIERFAAYHARAITVDAKAANLRLGGRYSLEDLNGLLESIEAVLPVHITHQPGGNVRITATETSAKL